MHMMRDSFKSAVYEFVRGIGMLQSYCSLNKLAALNLVNKYELLSRRDATLIEQVVTDMVNACEFPFGTEDMTAMVRIALCVCVVVVVVVVVVVDRH